MQPNFADDNAPFRVTPDADAFLSQFHVLAAFGRRDAPTLLPHRKPGQLGRLDEPTTWFDLAGPRYYLLREPLAPGKKGYTYSAVACDSQGHPIEASPPLVVKLPFVPLRTRHVDPNYPRQGIQRLLDKVVDRLEVEVTDICGKVRRCASANVILDLGRVPGIRLERFDGRGWRQEALLNTYFSVQLQLQKENGYFSLKDYVKAAMGPSYTFGAPVTNASFFLKLAFMVARALKELHIRRIKHGDVWPQNMFVRTEAFDDTLQLEPDLIRGLPVRQFSDQDYGLKIPINDLIVFIDFGEAWDYEEGEQPGAIYRDNAYAGPELTSSTFGASEASDVYAYGAFLYWLATGGMGGLSDDLLSTPEKIPYVDKADGSTRIERDVREAIRERIEKSNPGLLRSLTWVVDLIVACTRYDQVDRPRMIDVAAELAHCCDRFVAESERTNDLSTQQAAPLASTDPTNHKTKPLRYKQDLTLVASHIEECLGTLDRSGGAGQIFESIVDYRLHELSEFTEALVADMVDLVDARNVLIDHLVRLYEGLDQGSSIMSVTVLNAWQKKGYGHDGRYATANLEALKRGVGIARVFCVSVEELGIEFSKRLLESLNDTRAKMAARHALDYIQLERMVIALDQAIVDLQQESSLGAFQGSGVDESTQMLMSQRLELILSGYIRMSASYTDFFFHKGESNQPGLMFHPYQLEDLPDPILKSLFLGLRMFSTVDRALSYRMARTRTVVHRPDGVDAPNSRKSEWLLVESAFRGRQDLRFTAYPELARLKIYLSKKKNPIALDVLQLALGADHSIPVANDPTPCYPINVGAFINILRDCVAQARLTASKI